MSCLLTLTKTGSCTHSLIGIKQIGYVLTICNMDLSSFLMSVEKVSHWKQLHYFVGYHKHVACNAEHNCVTYRKKNVAPYKLHIDPVV
jgi:putative IMPACT (imprinted ancient) family translation regulator